MTESLKHVATLGNSIIGVSVLAMPYCFKQCGVILGIVMLMISALLTRFNCHLLLKAALLCRRKTYELVAFHSFGFYGKLVVEASIIGFMMGILISFYVVIGDLGPPIIGKKLEIETIPELRNIFLIALGLGVALPLGFLRNISSLGGISTLSISFYIFLVIKVFIDALPVFASGSWLDKVNFWQPGGILQCLPIFSLALSCQTQIFEIFDSLPDPSLGKMNKMIKMAVYFCASVYVLVGFFGYVAFCNEELSGNALVMMPSSSMTQLIKLGFVLSVVLSFPLVIFPCRASLYSLFNNKKLHSTLDVGSAFIPEQSFRTITVALVVSTLVLGILCPNIELVLGLVGSTIGTVICIIFPAMIFIRVTNRNTFERTGAQIVLCAGIFILVACSIATINNTGDSTKYPKVEMSDRGMLKISQKTEIKFIPDEVVPKIDVSKIDAGKILTISPAVVLDVKEAAQVPPKVIEVKDDELKNVKKTIGEKIDKVEEDQEDGRKEPPVPQEPEVNKVDVEVKIPDIEAEKKKVELKDPLPPTIQAATPNNDPIKKPTPDTNPPNVVQQKDVVVKDNKDAVSPKDVAADGVAAEQKEILKQLAVQQEQQKKLIEEQKQVLEELKAHKEAHKKLLSDAISSKLGLVEKEDSKQTAEKNVAKKLPVEQRNIIPPVLDPLMKNNIQSGGDKSENIQNEKSEEIPLKIVINSTMRVLKLGEGSRAEPIPVENKAKAKDEIIAEVRPNPVATKAADVANNPPVQPQNNANKPLVEESQRVQVAENTVQPISKSNNIIVEKKVLNSVAATEKSHLEIRRREILMEDLGDPVQHLAIVGKVSQPTFRQK